MTGLDRASVATTRQTQQTPYKPYHSAITSERLPTVRHYTSPPMLLRILSIVFPIFIIVIAGFLYGRKHRPEMMAANKLNMEVFLPALIFTALAGKSFELADNIPSIVGALVIVFGSGLIAHPHQDHAKLGPCIAVTGRGADRILERDQSGAEISGLYGLLRLGQHFFHAIVFLDSRGGRHIGQGRAGDSRAGQHHGG